MYNIKNWSFALMGGCLLALMLYYNGIMAKHSSPVFSAMVLHGIGTVGSFLLIISFSYVFSRRKKIDYFDRNVPWWAYLGGIPGALGMILAGVLVNTKLSLAGIFALMLTSQIIFGIFLDVFGLMGQPKRNLVLNDLFATLCIFLGSLMIIFFGP